MAQNQLTKDQLLGGFLPERVHWDLLHYDYTIEVQPKTKFIRGFNKITFQLTQPLQRMQVDLHENLKVNRIRYNDQELTFERTHWSIFIDLPPLEIHQRTEITVEYEGHPIVAKNAPWDGGYVSELDKNGKYLIGMAVQGEGSSIWLPSKDGQSDEPNEGVIANIIVPSDLVAVSNGRLIGHEDLKEKRTKWTWQVVNPINSYCITFNIGDYVEIKRTHNGLDLSYWVLRDHQTLAEKHFEVVPEMLSIFEKYFGPYPFPEDGYKIVETSFAGMEHQSNIAYGNKYKKGYGGMGNEIARRFDFILIHESAHEWFGNSITSIDIADMWIHEAFTTYAEYLYVEEKWGYDAALRYMEQGIQQISLQHPIIGTFGCNHKGDSDMYYKGAMMLQTLRTHLQNDELFFATLKGFYLTFQKNIIDGAQVVDYFSKELKMDLTPFFATYLTQSGLPTLVISKENNTAHFTRVQGDFNLRIPIQVKNKVLYKLFSTQKQSLKLNSKYSIDARKSLVNIEYH